MSEFKYGLNLLVYTAAFSADQLGLVSKVADMGYDGVEVPFNDLSILDPAATRKACEAAGVDMTACCVIMPGQSISSPDADERVRGVGRLQKMVDITAEMGGNIVSGPLYAPVGHLTGRARTEDEWNWCADGLAAGAEYAAAAGVTLVIEPLNRFETYLFNTAADATKLVETVGSENLKIQIDTFHGNIEEKDTAAAIRATGKWLGHFHASESDRGALGTGQVRWSEVFAALHEINYSGWVTIESFATGILDLCAAACIWREIYESADALAIDGLAFLKQAAQA
ncbi:MAG: sugar phosphate isomerase/epimerase family protein [Phycisphaerae bacterium]|jgi:D-psicose/D-tagatose/L-ribulose 3-epimerase|nr:sugar phosphate isomerase/epimerase family protein [Phycisphaerae bacterium]MDP7290222.1 sugar phosphate isomerase/epimerase family protein [Phycisphaerae bacterium]